MGDENNQQGTNKQWKSSVIETVRWFRQFFEENGHAISQDHKLAKMSKKRIEESAEMIKVEPLKDKVEYEIRDVIRAYPEDFPRIVKAFQEFTEQFK